MKNENLEKYSANSVTLLGRLILKQQLKKKTIISIETDLNYVKLVVSGLLKEAVDNLKIGQFACIQGYIGSSKINGENKTKLEITRVWDIGPFRAMGNTIEIAGELQNIEWLSTNSAKITVATNFNNNYNTVPIFVPDATMFIFNLQKTIKIIGHVESAMPITAKKWGPPLFIADFQVDNIIYN